MTGDLTILNGNINAEGIFADWMIIDATGTTQISALTVTAANLGTAITATGGGGGTGAGIIVDSGLSTQPAIWVLGGETWLKDTEITAQTGTVGLLVNGWPGQDAVQLDSNDNAGNALNIIQGVTTLLNTVINAPPTTVGLTISGATTTPVLAADIAGPVRITGDNGAAQTTMDTLTVVAGTGLPGSRAIVATSSQVSAAAAAPGGPGWSLQPRRTERMAGCACAWLAWCW